MRIEITHAPKVQYLYKENFIPARYIGSMEEVRNKHLIWVPASSHKDFDCGFFVVTKQLAPHTYQDMDTPEYVNNNS